MSSWELKWGRALWMWTLLATIFLIQSDPVNAKLSGTVYVAGQREKLVHSTEFWEDAKRIDDLQVLFLEAQAQRQKHNYERSSRLYDMVLNGCGNHSLAYQQLRMWVQYQHADLLMRYIAPSVKTVADSAAVKRQAIAKFQEAVSLGDYAWPADASPRFGISEKMHAFNSMGILAADIHELEQAVTYYQLALAANASAPEPMANLAVLYLKLGHLDAALDASTRALELAPEDARLMQNMGTVFYERGDEVLAQFWWEQTIRKDPFAGGAMANLATIYGFQGDSVRAFELLSQAVQVTPQGPNHESYRLQQVLCHLQMIYESTDEVHSARSKFDAALAALYRGRVTFPDPLGTIGSGSMGYYAIYQGYQDKIIRRQLAQVYHQGAEEVLAYAADHVTAGQKNQGYDNARVSNTRVTTVLPRHRIRVGFLSAFFYHHSVGLLLSGIIRHLPRDEFDVFVLTFEASRTDSLTKKIKASVEPHHWIVVSERDLWQSQRQIAALELDILVFGEIGMHAATYFLAFARLAHRSVQFWGHAVTSGISTIDYFVSSELFRRGQANPSDQDQYNECLYEMKGLTTLFPRPPAPQSGLSRLDFNLPDKSVTAHMVLVPQTLYKLHPDFDTVIQRVLSRVTTSILVLPIGDKPLLVQQLTRRWRTGGIIDRSVYKRIFFVRKMNATEFLALCEMADLVLDPFPVGGGRSSFEVFSVGTPILGLASRTTILQLTLAMYRRMGINASCCMFDSEEELVNTAVQLLRDDSARRDLQARIEQNNYKLYEASNGHVVREWEVFFKLIITNDPPKTVPYDNEHVTQGRCPEWTQKREPLEPRLVYQSALQGAVSLDGKPQRLHPRVVQLFDLDDPSEIARMTTDDMLQAAFLEKVFWNMQQRFRHRIVDSFLIRSRSSGTSYPIEIREGDDLDLVVRWQLHQKVILQDPPLHDALDRLVLQTLEVARRRVPQHTTDLWREARALVPSRDFRGIASKRRDCVALVVTTCKRLELFRRTIRSLARALRITQHRQWRDHFCSVLVIDDNSSDGDRRKMRAMFPFFSFIWKAPTQKGHAVSLNLALRELHWVRFVLYLEDDWEFGYSTTSDFVRDAVTVLRSTPLAQMLLNDQRGGHEKMLTTITNRHVIRYAVHEFAVLDPAHTFSYWPGFSLNPAVWDLAKLTLAIPDSEPFRLNTDLFEREFALRVWRAGLHVGYLHGVTMCSHIGAAPGSNASAYVLNGQPRRFD